MGLQFLCLLISTAFCICQPFILLTATYLKEQYINSGTDNWESSPNSDNFSGHRQGQMLTQYKFRCTGNSDCCLIRTKSPHFFVLIKRYLLPDLRNFPVLFSIFHIYFFNVLTFKYS